MWLYEKRLQYPVNVRKPDAKTAKIVISQLGGPNGELGAALRYLNQRYTMPYPRIQALLTDIGTEELAHVERSEERRVGKECRCLRSAAH